MVAMKMCKHLLKNKLLLPILWRFNRNFHQSLENIRSGTVIISLTNDIYSNLALEEWLFKRLSFDSNQCLLLMWANEKTIVFGRHQNPWDECHINVCKSNNVNICRRQSGGGTVFHDDNNLNISFFTNKKHYNRRSNLTFLKDVLKQYYNIDCDISKREDLVLSDGGFKISGTASKLAAINAYHHCTLLVDVDLELMRQVIRKHSLNIDSKATKSVPSAVKNLSSISREICIQSLTRNLAKHFRAKHKNNDFVYEIDVNEDSFPGISEIITNLKTWDWIYGKTPRFTVKTIIENTVIECKITVYRGIIENVEFNPPIVCPPNFISLRFTIEDVDLALKRWMHSLQTPNFSELVYNSIIKAIKKIYD